MNSATIRQLSCGATLIVEPMAGVRSAAMCWLLAGGCGFDPIDRQGRATLWEELLLRGAGGLNSREQADAFDKIGVSRATETGTYTLRLSASMLGIRIPDAIPLMCDTIRSPRMDEDAIEPCKDLALQAIESVKDDPTERATILARERHHAPPRDRSGLGTPDGIRAITRDELLNGWRACGVPEGSIIAFAGDVDAGQIEKQLNALLAGWRGSVNEPNIGAVPERGQYHEADDSSQVQIMLVHDAPSEAHPDSMLERFAISVLSGGMSGRLFSEVREKRGLCYSVSASYRAERDHGTVTAYVGTTPERAQQSLDVLWEQLHHLHTSAGVVTAEEFQRARIGMKSGIIFSGESSAARAASLASDFRKLGRARSLEEVSAQVDAVSLEEINAYLKRRQMGKVTIQTLGPTALKPPSGVPVR